MDFEFTAENQHFLIMIFLPLHYELHMQYKSFIKQTIKKILSTPIPPS